MGIILNEVIQAEEIIESGEVDNNPARTIYLLARYYRQKEGLGKIGAYNKIIDFLKANYKNFNSALWEDTIEEAAKKGIKRPLLEIESVGITQKEIDTIRSLKDLKYERLLFTMLCYAKFYNLVSEKNNGWVNAEVKELYSVARVTVRYKLDKFLYLNDLERMGYIAFSKKNDNLNLRITFIDDDGEPVLQIRDYRELGYEYLNYIGEGKFIRCAECGRLVKKKSKMDFSSKYCHECAKNVEREKSTLRKRKQRESENVTEASSSENG